MAFPKTVRSFQTDPSRPVDTFYLSRHIHEHEQRLGWPQRLTCHSFRHAFGTHLYENGTDLLTIKALIRSILLLSFTSLMSSGKLPLPSSTVSLENWVPIFPSAPTADIWNSIIIPAATVIARTVRLSTKKSGWTNAGQRLLTLLTFM